MGVSPLDMLEDAANQSQLKYQKIDDHTLYFPFTGEFSQSISVFAIYQHPVIVVSSPVLEGAAKDNDPALLTEFLVLSNELDFAKVCFDHHTETLGIRIDFHAENVTSELLLNSLYLAAQASNQIHRIMKSHGATAEQNAPA